MELKTITCCTRCGKYCFVKLAEFAGYACDGCNARGTLTEVARMEDYRELKNKCDELQERLNAAEARCCAFADENEGINRLDHVLATMGKGTWMSCQYDGDDADLVIYCNSLEDAQRLQAAIAPCIG